MTPAQFIEWGSKLGDGWQSALARLLPCNVRTVQYWVAGKREIRPMVAKHIKDTVRSEVIRRATKPTTNPPVTHRVSEETVVDKQETEQKELDSVAKTEKPKTHRVVRRKNSAAFDHTMKTWNEIKRAPVGSLLKPPKK